MKFPFDLDWVGSTFGLLGAVVIMLDARVAAVIWIISNLAWIIWTHRTIKKKSILAQQFGYLLINTTTLIVRWNKP